MLGAAPVLFKSPWFLCEEWATKEQDRKRGDQTGYWKGPGKRQWCLTQAGLSEMVRSGPSVTLERTSELTGLPGGLDVGAELSRETG